MFFWKKEKTNKIEAPPENIIKIPEEFYGAKDPVVHYNSAAKSTAVIQKAESVGLVGKKSTATAWVSKLGFLRNKRLLFGLIIAGFLIVVGLISWYYVWQARKQMVAPVITAPTEQPKEEQPAPVEENTEEPMMEEPIAEAATSTEEAVEEPVSLGPQPLQFPTILLMNSSDIDSDSLTDLEEELFGIDSGTWDTDGDGYYDGQEVFNLYNPAGVAPMKIIDSGLAKEYVNPIWQYRVYYPAQWQVGEVDDEKKAVLFSAITGDYVEIFVSVKDAGETFDDWFAREATEQSYADLQPFTNRFQEDGWKRQDDLTAYFVTDSQVFVLLYNPGVTGSIPFRHVMQMMWQSFRPSKTSVAIPEQTVLPAAPTSSEMFEEESLI
ncbi:MAG: hypothetical protein HY980_03395 [Candidatus Magasanikbacteria bacterium]|nr:hypothetical protein [Candidatus Magasanikbacteria bacterium]